MPSTDAHLSMFTKEELIRYVQTLEGDLAVAAKGLMSVQSRSEMEWELRKKDAEIADSSAENIQLTNRLMIVEKRIPRWIRWFFNV